MENDNTYLYSAFISYRHADPDQIIAKRIQHSIETYKIPAVYQNPAGQKKFRKVFRDSDELSLDRDLAGGIDYALAQSEYLIVILSHQYKDSPWCLHEIEEFLKTHDRKNVLCVLAEGEPRDVLPEIITHVPSEEDPGEIIIREPLCADYRQEQTTADRFELPRLLCAMLHCTYDDLIKREAVYRRKRYIKLAAAALGAALFIFTLQMYNLVQLSKAYQDTVYSQSQTLAAQSLRHLSDFDREKALELALSALPEDGSDDSPTVTPESLNAIAKATYAYQPAAFAQIRSRSMQNDIIDYAVTPVKKHIITLDSSAWILVQTASGDKISYWQIDGANMYYFGFTAQDEANVIAWRGGNIYSYNFENYTRNWGVNVIDENYSGVILFADLINDSSCSVMTGSGITVLDPSDGHVKAALSADAVTDAVERDIKDEDGSGNEGSDTPPEFTFMRQSADEKGRIIFSGSLSFAGDEARSEKLCIAVWDPETDVLKAQYYDMPAYCLQLEAPSKDSLVAIAADTAFDILSANRFSTGKSENEFSHVNILCVDAGTLELKWDYDTDVLQTVNVPRVHYVEPGKAGDAPLVSVTFDVDNYIFDLDTGELFSSATLPDHIMMIMSVERELSVFYCVNHKCYSLYNEKNCLAESDGMLPFPDEVQAAVLLDDQVLAFSNEFIYWFGTVRDTNSSGSSCLNSTNHFTGFADAGINLLAALSNDKLFIIDLKEQKVIHEFSLESYYNSDLHTNTQLVGSLPDEKGALIASMHTDTGTVKLYSYDTGTDSFTELHTFFETAQFNRDVIWTNCLAYGNGTVYMVSPDDENTLLYYNTQDGAHGAIPVTGIPSPMRLAETYDDFANEHSITLPHLTISPDSRYLFSTVFDPSDSKVRDAVINLDTGQCTILKSYGKDAARSHFAAFNEDSTILACSTDYRILLYSNGFSSQDEISIDGLNVSTMTWFKNDLWVKFTNNTVRRYNAEGELISDIALDYNQSTRFTLNTKWAAVPITDSEEALMLIDSGDMNLLSPNDSTVTPILHVPDFVGWNNNSDTFLVLSPDPGEDHNEDTGLPGLYIYSYPRYTTLDLIRLGEKQLRDMAEQAK